jgi:hypothetical protein
LPAVSFGWAVGIYLSFRFGEFFGPGWQWLVWVGAPVVGFVQWRMLRGRLRWAIVWWPATVMATYAGVFAGFSAGFEAFDHYGLVEAYAVGSIVGGATIGLLSGLVLVWLLGRPSGMASLQPPREGSSEPDAESAPQGAPRSVPSDE